MAHDIDNIMPDYDIDRHALRVERAHVAILLFAAIAYWLVFWQYTGNRLEDALITWRYAENLATGQGFTFNPGERVLGTTAPLHALLLAGVAWLLGPALIPSIAFWSMALAGAVAGLFSYAALRAMHFAHPVALLATALMLFQPNIVRAVTGGMETALLLAMMSVSLFALLRGAFFWSALMAGLLFLVRPDSLVWSGVLFIAATIKAPRRATFALTPGLLVIGTWTVASLIYFGDWLPHSVRAKSAMIAATPSNGFDVAGMIAHFWWTLRAIGVAFTDGLPQQSALALWIAAIGVGGVLMMQRARRPTGAALFAFPVALSVSYYLVNAPHIFEWYLVPLTWALVLVGGTGLGYMVRKLLEHSDQEDERRGGLATAWLLMIIILTVWVNGNRRELHVGKSLQGFEDSTRRAVGQWIDEHAPPDATVAMEAIGYQGTYCHRHVIDFAGLISPQVVQLRRASASNAEVFRQIIEDMHPDYIVLRSFEVEHNQHLHGGKLFESQATEKRFRDTYKLAQEFNGKSDVVLEALSSISIWQRQDRQAPGAARITTQ